MGSEILVAIIGIIGVVVGAVTQYIFTRVTESMKHYQELRSHAYTDFIRAVSGLAISQRSGSRDRELEFTTLLTDAKGRISVYGSKQVIQSISDFFRHYSELSSPEALNAFVNIVQKMRSDTISKGEKVLDEQIFILLFGRKQST
jgi:ATP-dependent protease HslVU (ClpYQ) peptidase subunit